MTSADQYVLICKKEPYWTTTEYTTPPAHLPYNHAAVFAMKHDTFLVSLAIGIFSLYKIGPFSECCNILVT